MLIEFLSTISIDKKPFAENLRLNVDAKAKQLRLKVTYITNDGNRFPIDLVVFRWDLSLEKLSLSISFDGREMNTGNDFQIKFMYDVLRKQIKVVGKVSNRDLSIYVKSARELLEIPKAIANIP